MMNKKIFVPLCLILASCFLFSGCQLAVKNAGEITDEDKLCGFYITLQPLPTKETTLDNKDILKIINGETTLAKSSKERFYATAKEVYEGEDKTIEYTFTGIDGIPFYHALILGETEEQNCEDLVNGPEIYDPDFNIGSEITLDGTLYIDSSLNSTMYCNPVYETSAGEIYMIRADMGAEITDGFEQSMSASSTTTFFLGETEIVTTTIKIKVRTIDPAKTIILKQFSKKDELLCTTTITKDNIPKYIAKEAKTDYIIAETHGLNSEKTYAVSREFVDLNEDTYNCLFLNNKGFAVPYPIEIK